MSMQKIFKRFIDILSAVILLGVLLLPMFIISLVITLGDSGPVIFKQERSGYKNKKFNIYKFRTMKFNPTEPGEEKTLVNDKRITKVGSILRKTSLDELPQLLNVMNGSMSLVGPRPRVFKENLTKEERERLSMRPGITGLAQAYGRSALSPRNRMKFDLFYVRNYSLKMDYKIFIETIKSVLQRKGSN